MKQHITERPDRRKTMNDSRGVDAAKQIHQLLRPRCGVKLEWQTGQREQQECRNNDDMHANVHYCETPDVLAAVFLYVKLSGEKWHAAIGLAAGLFAIVFVLSRILGLYFYEGILFL